MRIRTFVRSVQRVPRAFTAAAAGAAGWLVFYGAWLALDPLGPRGEVVFGNTAYLVPMALAVALPAWAWRRSEGSTRTLWAVVAVANTLWLGAEVLWAVRELSSGEVPFPWWTDVGYLGSYALLAAAVLFAYRPTLRTVGAAGLLDGAIVVGAVALAWWWLVLRPLDVGDGFPAAVAFAYPAFGLVLLGLLVATRLLPARRGTLSMQLFAGAIAATAVADGLYANLAITATYVSGDWIDLGWQACALLLALSALASGLGVDRRSDWLRWRPVSAQATLTIVGGALAVGVFVLGVEASRGSLGAIAAVGAGTLFVLGAARSGLLLATQARSSTLRDPLTGTYDAAYFVEQVRAHAGRARYFGEQYAVVLVDIDVGDPNDAGLTALRCTRRVVGAVRGVDVVARLSEGRLAVLAPRVDASDARDVAERLRRSVVCPTLAVEPELGPGLLVAVAVAVTRPGEDGDELLERADAMLATVHALGGNHVCGPEAPLLTTSTVLGPAERRELDALVRVVDEREGDDCGHAHRVSRLAADLAVELELEGATAERAALVGLVHDLGRLGEPDAAFRRERPLDGREWARSVEQTRRGAELLWRVPALRHLSPLLASVHEHWDGSGLPRGLAGAEIPIEARIVAVADELVSMVTERMYRQPLSLTTALTEIWRWADRRFDPAVVNALFRLLREGGLADLPAAETVERLVEAG